VLTKVTNSHCVPPKKLTFGLRSNFVYTMSHLLFNVLLVGITERMGRENGFEFRKKRMKRSVKFIIDLIDMI